MLPFEITILGNNSAVPAFGRHPSSQLINIHHNYILVDCGEGTQMRLQEVKAKTSKIEHIFITHLHGDHFFGLIGLLTSMNLLGRIKPLTVHAHAEVEEILNIQLKHTKAEFSFPFAINPLPEEGTKVIYNDDFVEVTAFQLEHRISCCGFLFKEVFSKLKVNKAKLEELNIPNTEWSKIQAGEDYLFADGQIISNAVLVEEGPKPRTYAYCSDTRYIESFIPVIKGCDTVYIESTYANKDADKAFNRYHCTAEQAATIAKKAGVGRLLLGHFSSKYKDLSIMLEEATPIFENTEISEESKTYVIELW